MKLKNIFLRVHYEFGPNAKKFSVKAYASELGGKVRNGSRRPTLHFYKPQHSIAPWLKPVHFIDWRGERENPEPFRLFTLRFSICKSGAKTSLGPVQAIRVEQASPVALGGFGHALLAHLISWESICACSSREGSHKLNWVTCSEMVSFSTDGPGDAWWSC